MWGALQPNHFAETLDETLPIVEVGFGEVVMRAKRQAKPVHHAGKVRIVFIELGMERLHIGVLAQVVW